jgi:DNA polymerase-3 subunit epsilon
MREIVLDTETTGLDPADGHRIVEIGAVELVNHMPTGEVYHQYINPERPMPAEAYRVHGLGDDFLRDKPRFMEIADAFEAFLGDARLVIHNAAFDMAMINAEFTRLGRPVLPMERAFDTVKLAKERFPGAQASLDALCKRFGIDLSVREKHGALLDSELLAEVYLELLGGRQYGMTLDAGGRGPGAARTGAAVAAPTVRERPVPLPQRITDAERAAHAAFVAELGEGALWNRPRGG